MGGYLPTVGVGVVAHTPDKRGRGAKRMLTSQKPQKGTSAKKDTLSPEDERLASPDQAYPNMLH